MKFFIPILMLMALGVNLQAQCSLDSEVCFTYCNDTWNGDGSGLTCFDPREATADNPGQFSFCYTHPKEILTVGTNPFNQSLFTYKRYALVHVCLPEDICQASYSLHSVTIEGGMETGSVLLEEDPDLYTDTNRGTICNSCPDPNRYFTLRSHRDPASAVGTYRMELSYTCCDSDGEPMGTGSTSFYYEILDAASDVDVEIAYLASEQIENINGDPDIDGIIASDGTFPGPELGPASAGVRVSAVGNGVSEYTVELYEVDCSDPTGGEILINSQVIPYSGNSEIFYSFLNIPDWENVYTAGACYKVVTKVSSVCDEYEEVGFFTITDECTFCLTNGNQNSFQPNFRSSNDNINVVSDTKLKSVYVLDMWGRLLDRRENINQHELDMPFRMAANSGQYVLVVIIDESGRVKKNMVLNNGDF